MSKDRNEKNVFLSLGGNIGDPSNTIEDALGHLSSQRGIRVVTRSPFYRTPPWGKTDQADFINACALVRTTLSAQALLKACLDVEDGMGRRRAERWGPRTIDIDILTYGEEVIEEDNLIVPHPYLAERAFVPHSLEGYCTRLQPERTQHRCDDCRCRRLWHHTA